jgi:hypothetical protein
MDRYDLETVAAMLLTSIAVALNLVFLQAAEAMDESRGKLVLIPILAGLAVALSGFVSHMRRHGRDMVIVDRIWAGSVLYLGLSVATSLAFQPRPE